MNVPILKSTPETEWGRFHNPMGYTITQHHVEQTLYIFPKAIFEFKLINPPLLFEDAKHRLWMTDKHFLTDWGSIPIILQPLIQKDIYLGYLFHDSAFKHHGLWLFNKVTNTFEFHKLNMTESNQLLYEMMRAQGAWYMTAATVYRTLQTVGKFAWNDSKSHKRAGTQSIQLD